jgi:hypothetical protein
MGVSVGAPGLDFENWETRRPLKGSAIPVNAIPCTEEYLAGGCFGPPVFCLPTLNLLTPASLQPPAAFVAAVEQAGWVALALGASLLSWLLSRRLAGLSRLF